MAVLLVANFGTDTGYAWNVIGEYFAGIAEAMFSRGIKTFVCYKTISKEAPAITAKGLPLDIFAFDYHQKGFAHLLKFLKILRTKGIDTLYLIDQPTYAFRYFLYRLAGVKYIIIHDHTSGKRTIPRGGKYLMKKIAHSLFLISGDYFIGVSRFVVDRLISVNCVPPQKATCIYNGVNIVKYSPADDELLLRELSIGKDKKIVFFSGRANYYKGVHVLIEAAEELLIRRKRADVVFVCCGEGPDMADFREMAVNKNIQHSFFFLGKRNDVDRMLKSATVAVVPSIWEEAFGLSVIEAMASGLPVIASKVGGIPEIIEHGISGYLVEPGRPDTLADMIQELLENEQICRTVGASARKRVVDCFDIRRSITELQGFLLSHTQERQALQQEKVI